MRLLQVTVITFNNTVDATQTQPKSSLNRARVVDSIQPSGGTALYDAARLGLVGGMTQHLGLSAIVVGHCCSLWPLREYSAFTVS